MRDDIEPGDEFEELVFRLILEKKIPELVEGDIFQSDMKGIDRLTKPDLVHFFQTDEYEVTMVPYDIKYSRIGIKPQQASPLTLAVLDANQQGVFHKRLMENLEKYGWQNCEYRFKEGSMIIRKVKPKYDLGDKLTFIQKPSNEKSLEKIERFKRLIGFYTVDALFVESDADKDLDIQDLEKILSQVDWFSLRSPENTEIIYSASKNIRKKQKGKQILVRKNDLWSKTDIAPFIVVPPKYLK